MVTPMENLPNGFRIGELYCVPHGVAGDRFLVIPGNPRIELDPHNKPKAVLMNSPDAAVLSLQAVWTVERNELDAVRNEIGKRYPGLGDYGLEIAPLQEVTASLEVGGPDGETVRFGPQQASGTDTQRVTFSETLAGQAKQAAIDAFGGREDTLRLTYVGTLNLTEEVAVSASGDLAEDLKALAPKKPKSGGRGWFGSKQDAEKETPKPDVVACLAQVGRAIEAGRLAVAVKATPNASPALRAKAENSVQAMVANDLLRMLGQLGDDAASLTNFTVSHRGGATEPVSYPIVRSLDCGTWFQSHGVSGYIEETTVPLGNPNRPPQ